MSGVYLGIDPGASGGIALLDEGGKVLMLEKMPSSEEGIAGLFRNRRWPTEFLRTTLKNNEFYVMGRAAIERVGGYVAGNPAPGSAMFNFGASYGFLRGCLMVSGITFEAPTPQRWQRDLGVEPRGKQESQAEFKRRLRELAVEIFPGVKVTLSTSDALLIAEWARRYYGGEGFGERRRN